MNKDIMIKLGFTQEVELVERGICPLCKKPMGSFTDALSARENEISGLCQTCQDDIFD